MSKIFKTLLILFVLLPMILVSCSDSSDSAMNKASGAAAVSGSDAGPETKKYNTIDINFSISNLIQNRVSAKTVSGDFSVDDDYTVDSLYWRYTAVLDSDTNAPGNTGSTETTITDGAGIGETVSGFAPGVWKFTLFAYLDSGFETMLYMSPVIEVELKFTTVTNSVVVPVNKIKDASKGNGRIVLDVENIVFSGEIPEIEDFRGVENVHVSYSLISAPEDVHPLTSDNDYTAVVSPGSYLISLRFDYEGVAYADAIAVEVYSNFSTVLRGVMDYRKPGKYRNEFYDLDEFYNVEYWTNYSSFTNDPLFYEHTYASTELIKTPVKPYFDFVGWTTHSDGYFEETSVTRFPARDHEAKTYYAYFTPITYTITYDMNAFLYNSDTVDTSVKTPTGMIESYDFTSETFYLKNDLTRDGYTFNTWTSGTTVDDATSFSNYAVQKNTSGDLNFIASWTPNKYYVKFTTGTGGGGSTVATGAMENQEFTFDDAPRTLTANTLEKDGYTFKEWKISGKATTFTDEGEVQNLTTESDGVVELEAVWTSNTYTLIFDGNADGASSKGNRSEVTGSMDDFRMIYDAAPVALPLTGFSREGYTLQGWSKDKDVFVTETDKYYTSSGTWNNITTESDITLYAVWKINTYTITFEVATSPTGFGTEFGDIDSYSIEGVEYKDVISFTDLTFFATATDGVLHTVTAAPADALTGYAYSFAGWSNYPENYEVTSDITVTATFERGDFPGFTPSPVNKATVINIDYMSMRPEFENATVEIGGPYEVKYGDTSLSTSALSASSLTGYQLEGFYLCKVVNKEIESRMKVVDRDGSFVPSASFDEIDYVDAEGKWIYRGDSILLYANWTNE